MIRSLLLPRMAVFCAVLTSAAIAWAQAGGGQSFGLGGGFGRSGRDAVVSVKAQFAEPASGKPGQLRVTATMKPGWHIYSITQPIQDIGPRPTKIEVADSADYRVTGPFQANPPPVKEKQKIFDDLVVETHGGEVVWSVPVEFRAGVSPANVRIKGKVRAQACDDNSCLPPQDFPFVASVGAGVAVVESEPPPPAKAPATVSGDAASGVRFDPQALVVTDEQQTRDTSFLGAILLGFLGGLILNIMPCVLPVIGLKLFSFMEQAGQDRWRSLVLNLWYAAGLLAVFEVLGVLAVTLDLGWGALFTYSGFSVAMAAIVFALGLSFLGVWEIPIPGFVGRGAANELAEKEGAAGAFAKGVLTTLLATPCSGPLLASALLWTARQPPLTTMAVFTAMGLGMASPYLLIGAFPQLIRVLPKPGAWMETFRQILGFVLMGTVVYVLSFMEWFYVVPTVGLMFGIWMACWWIGRTPLTADFQTRLRAWLMGAVLTGLAWLVSIGWLADVMRGRFDAKIDEATAARLASSDAPGLPGTTSPATGKKEGIAWQPFTRRGFEQLVAAEKTVMIDFTADWCLTCKTLEATVLNTQPVRELLDANRVVALKADWTHAAEEVTEMLEALGTKQVPVVAIFPAGEPNRPIRLLGTYGKETVLEALRRAGPSKSTAM